MGILLRCMYVCMMCMYGTHLPVLYVSTYSVFRVTLTFNTAIT